MRSPPSVYDGAAFGQHLLSIKNIAFTRILLDQGAYVAMIVFAAGFRHLIRQARPDYEWVSTLVFGAALVWLAVTLVADGLELAQSIALRRFHNAETWGWSDFSHGTPVACHHRINSQQSHALNRCLRDKNPVEGILMNGRQAVDGEGMFAGDG
jgi:hypothetical protein